MSLIKSVLRALKKGPLTQKQLKTATGASGKKLDKVLLLLERQQQVVQTGKGYAINTAPSAKPKVRVAVVKKTNDTVPAKIMKLGKGFGFATPTDGSPDIFIPGRAMLGAMPGDEVDIALFEHPRVEGSREGEVVAITGANNQVVGTVEILQGKLVIVPDNAPETAIAIRRNAAGGVLPGEKAAAEITLRGPRHSDHRARVVLRFGAADSAKECAAAIIYAAGVPQEFDDKAMAQAKYVATAKITESEEAGRKDLRKQVIFTIDSASTKDIDDAISAKKTKTGYQVGVHIADVSHYVQAKSPLDESALQRGTSIYYANSVIPMLPPELSNGICSLNPEEDRLAFSCIMDLDSEGRLVKYKFVKSLINSRVKGVYSEINDLMAGGKSPELLQKYKGVLPALTVMVEVYQKLKELRAARGCMEIESDEAKLLLDKNGKCVGVEKSQRGEAEKLIEEYMLLANSAAAQYAKALNIPFVYRVHEKPLPDKAAQLKVMLEAAGVPYKFKKDIPTQMELTKLLDKTRGTKMERFVHGAVLRSMAKAKYEPHPKGHFGLALEDYAHFTSPIRRYPDLAIHRILTDVAAGAPVGEVKKRYSQFADVASRQASQTELVAQGIERDCDDCYKAEYMKQFIGQSFEGVISSVMQFGIYVELANTVEGLVHVSRLSGEHLDLVEGFFLLNPLTGQSYRIGDEVEVVVVGVDVSRGNVDFDLAAHSPTRPGAPKG